MSPNKLPEQRGMANSWSEHIDQANKSPIQWPVMYSTNTIMLSMGLQIPMTVIPQFLFLRRISPDTVIAYSGSDEASVFKSYIFGSGIRTNPTNRRLMYNMAGSMIAIAIFGALAQPAGQKVQTTMHRGADFFCFPSAYSEPWQTIRQQCSCRAMSMSSSSNTSRLQGANRRPLDREPLGIHGPSPERSNRHCSWHEMNSGFHRKNL